MSDLKSKENCCGEYPALYRFTYTHECPVRVPDPNCSMDTVFSHMTTAHGQLDVVATSPGLAIETFKVERPASVYALTEGPTFICYIDAITSIAKYYGGHFS